MSDLDLSFIGLDWVIENIEAVLLCTIFASWIAIAGANAGIQDAQSYNDKCIEKWGQETWEEHCPNLKTRWILLKIIGIPISFGLSAIIVPIIANK